MIGLLTYKIVRESGSEQDDAGRTTQTARLTFQADSTTPDIDDEWSISTDFAAPKSGMPHPYIPGLTARRVNCRKVNHVLYEFDVDFAAQGKPGQAPWDEPPIIEYDFAVSEEAYDVDYEGTPLLFVTGEPPDPPVKDTFYDAIIRCSRNLRAENVDHELMTKYAGRINSDPVLGKFPPGTCKITEPPKARSATWNNETYYQATMGITVRRGEPGLYEDDKAWYKRVLAQGFYVATFKAANNGDIVIVHARDASGDKVTKPVLHEKQQGFMLPRDPSTGLQDPRKAEWYEFKPKRAPLPFAALAITN